MIKYLGLPINASENGVAVDNLLIYVHLLMLVLFVGWLTYFLYVLFRFRQSRNPTGDYVGVKSHASTYLEGVVAVVEGVLLFGFAIPLWAKVVDAFPAEKESTVMRVVAQQFAWNGLYPGPDGVFGRRDINLVSAANRFGVDPADPHSQDDFMVVNDLIVPVDRPVVVHLTSMDVIHSFAVKPMRVTQDAIPGMSIPFWFKPVQTGEYMITCAQLCGNSHYAMRGNLKVVPQAEYDEWVTTQAAAAAGAAGGYE